MVIAAIKGFSKGLIIALFSVVAFVVGIAAAIKLSAVVAAYLGENVSVGKQWLPIFSFAVVFILVVLLVRLGAKFIEKTVSLVVPGIINRVAGVLLYAILYTIIFSVLLFYVQKINLINQNTIGASVTYNYIAPWGPRAIDGFGKIVPVFKDMFAQLEHFFDNVAQKATEKPVTN